MEKEKSKWNTSEFFSRNVSRERGQKQMSLREKIQGRIATLQKRLETMPLKEFQATELSRGILELEWVLLELEKEENRVGGKRKTGDKSP